MLPLEHLQTTMARSVLAIEPVVSAKMLTAGKADPLARLRIYQNNTRSSLTAVLVAVFPVTVRLVDERFLRYVASEFIRRHPPVESRLARYGAGFPRFLKTIDTLRHADRRRNGSPRMGHRGGARYRFAATPQPCGL